ncbi:MAG: hypothetical protein PHW04_13710 [Candidatus Wallbacteria bacterium]|nr:hypothetical protein [Candidatus Wallbacteria bacterium]
MYAHEAKKYLVKSMSEARQMIKSDLGEEAVILHSKRLDDGASSYGGAFFEVLATAERKCFAVNTLRPQDKIKQLESELKEIKETLTQLVSLCQQKKGNLENTSHSPTEKKLMELGIDEPVVKKLASEMEMFDDKLDFESKLSKIIEKLPAAVDIKQKIYAFIGPTGVGKTTTLAKISSALKLSESELDPHRIIYITLDHYRLGAPEQLKNYSDILDSKTYRVYSVEQLQTVINEHQDHHVFIDTCGRSQHDCLEILESFMFLTTLGKKVYKYLVLSAVTKYDDLVDICESYKKFDYDEIIFTKLDETTNFGNLFSLIYLFGLRIRYITMGQMVPEDIRSFDIRRDLLNFLLHPNLVRVG